MCACVCGLPGASGAARQCACVLPVPVRTSSAAAGGDDRIGCGGCVECAPEGTSPSPVGKGALIGVCEGCALFLIDVFVFFCDLNCPRVRLLRGFDFRFSGKFPRASMKFFGSAAAGASPPTAGVCLKAAEPAASGERPAHSSTHAGPQDRSQGVGELGGLAGASGNPGTYGPSRRR